MRSRFRMGALALSGLLLVAACSSDDEGGATTTTAGDDVTTTAGGGATTTTGGSASGTGGDPAIVADDPLSGAEGSGLTRGVTDDSITIGCIFQSAFYPEAALGFEARFERANRDGGVAGRQIEFTGCEDDGGDAEQNLQLARQLVEQDDVFLIGTMSNAIQPATGDYLGDNEVPFTGWGFGTPFCAARWGFGFNGCLPGGVLPEDVLPHGWLQSNLVDAIVAASGLAPEDVRLAIQSGDDPASAAGAAQYVTLFEDRGAEIVYNEANLPSPGPVSDFTPFVQAILESDPNIVFASSSPANDTPLGAAIQAAGFDGPVMNFSGYAPGLLDTSEQLAAALEGAYINIQFPPQESGSEYISQVESDLEAIDAPNGSFISLSSAITYAQADLIVQLLEAVGEDLDTATFDETANGGSFTYHSELEGGPGDLQWPGGHFYAADCAAIMRVVDGAYEVAEPFRCYQSLRVR